MAGLSRVTQKIFAVNAPSTQLAKFGSLAAGTPVTTNDPATIQALSQFTDGWFAAVLGVNSPAIQDMNSLFFLATRQLAYLLTRGIPEWDSGTTYNIGDVVRSGSVLYTSLIDSNTNNAVTATADWAKIPQSRNVATKTSSYTLLSTDDVILADATSAAFALTLPAATGTGKVYHLKKIDQTANIVSITLNGSDTIDGDQLHQLDQPYQGLKIIDGGTGTWFVI